MVVTIEKAVGSAMSALAYNDRKVERGVASIVGYANLDSLDRADVQDVFEALERGRRSASSCCFHASVNPSTSDTCTEDQILAFVKQMMDDLGFSQQPYLVYRHDDVGRVHYHVVSDRIDRDGYRISRWHDRFIVQDLMERLGPELGFSSGRGSVTYSESIAEPEEKTRMQRPARFDPSAEVISQMRDILGYCLSYNMTTEAQFRMVMEDYGIRVSETVSGSQRRLVFKGLARDGKVATAPVGEEGLGLDACSLMESSLREGQRTHHIRTRAKARAVGLVSACFTYSRSEQHLRNMLSNKNVEMHVSYSDTGEPFGLTLVDHLTRTVFKGSELDGVLTVRMMKAAVESGKWRKADRGQKATENHVAASRQIASAMRVAMSAGAHRMGGGSAGSAGQSIDKDAQQRKSGADTYDNNVYDGNVYGKNNYGI